MFTGIVEEQGMVKRIDTTGKAPLTIQCRSVLEGTRIGDSLAVNGVCLTVAAMNDATFTANVQPITLRRTNLGRLHRGDTVNLERSAAVGQRIGGHYVQGHIDGVGQIREVRGDGPSRIVRIAAPRDLMRYVVDRGYVAIDGASLTVADLAPDRFDVSLVYHTQQVISLSDKRAGGEVNIEVDVFAKYVERLAERSPSAGVSLDTLRQAGFV